MPAPIKWTPEKDALLGTAIDREIARKLGVHKRTVTERRWELGIVSYKHGKWTQERIDLLGTVPDLELAEAMGVCNQSVARYRRDLGIPSWQSQHPYDYSKAARAERYQKNKEYHRSQGLKNRYGITLDDYEEMLEDQDGRCAICDKPPGKKRLSVDHNHTTGEIRGLLCSKCNRGLGWFQEDPELLDKAVEYLEEYL